MPRAAKPQEVEENGKRPYVPRLSISMTTESMRNMRIAAALADMRMGEWATAILEKAADKVIEDSK